MNCTTNENFGTCYSYSSSLIIKYRLHWYARQDKKIKPDFVDYACFLNFLKIFVIPLTRYTFSQFTES